MDEATANTLNLRLEAEQCQLQLKVALLRERKQLLDQDVLQEDINLLLSLAP